MYQKKELHIYAEDEKYANGYRVKYLEGIHNLIDQRKKSALENRMRFGDQIENNREQYRKLYGSMLGWPLTEKKQPVKSIRENILFQDEQRIISRIQFEIFDDFFFYGILIRHMGKDKLPLVIAQHGAGGTPEMCSSFFESENYNDLSLRIFNKGVNVFAPQLDLWGFPRFGPDNARRDLDNQLKQLGSSIAAVEVYCIQRCLDHFETMSYCNSKFGMAGLSYGGFYTLYTAAAETRIQAALACSHFNDRTKYHMPDKVWFNAGNTFLDAQVGALVCPRYLRIEVGDNDELFTADTARKEFEILRSYYKEVPENLQFHVFGGVHEFCPENESIDWLIEKLQDAGAERR